MNKDSIVWLVIVLTIVALASLSSCLVGTVFPPMLRVLHPTPTSSAIIGPPTIHEIRRAAELATVKYALSTEVTDAHVPNDIRRSLGVKEEILLIAHGEVAAGFDLRELGADDIWVDGTRVQLHLPAPQILYVRLDNKRTRVVYYKKTLLIERDLALETRAREQAEDILRQAALEADVLARAADYGRLFFANWLYDLGFTEVRVIIG